MTDDKLSETETRPASPNRLFDRTVLGIMCSGGLRRRGTLAVLAEAREETLQERDLFSRRFIVVEG